MQEFPFNRTSEDAAPTVGTLHYAERTDSSEQVPLNLGGLSRRRGPLTDRLVRGWRVLLRPSDDRRRAGLAEVASSETATPVGTLTEPAEALGVLRYEPVLFAHANLQEYRARRLREEQLGRMVLSVMAIALTVSVGVVFFVHPGERKPTTLDAPAAAPPAAPLVAPERPAIAAYTVKRGDTLGEIAARHDLKLGDLLAANDLTEHSTLRIGWTLRIPTAGAAVGARLDPAAIVPPYAPGYSPANPGRTAPGLSGPEAAAVRSGAPARYTVRRGDFPELIARRHGIRPDTLLYANRLAPGALIHPGQVLKIPPADGYYHAVRRGQSVAQFLRATGADAEGFRRYNPGVGDALRAKQTVFVPGKVPALPAGVSNKPDRPPNKRFRARDGRVRPTRGFWGDIGRAVAEGFDWPISSRAVSSGFGSRGRDWHPGIDIRAGVGTPIRAARDGVVTRAGWEGAYGRLVEIDHGGGFRTRYAHASKLLVDPGERVEAGAIIGRVGTSGNSTGPHLHYEVRVNGRPVNPRKVH